MLKPKYKLSVRIKRAIKSALGYLYIKLKSLIGFLVILTIALLLFIVNWIEYIALIIVSSWCGYHMWMEYGKALSIFSFFVLYFLGLIVINFDKKENKDVSENN